MLLFSLSLELINDVPHITANTCGTEDYKEKEHLLEIKMIAVIHLQLPTT